MNEQALIHDAQKGDLDAFNSLILHYQDSVFNTALRILGDDDLAADATQDAFISAFKSINSFRGGSFKAWLMRTVTNACYDELRRQKRRLSHCGARRSPRCSARCPLMRRAVSGYDQR